MSALLEVENIETYYGASQALFGMSLTIGEGEMVTLLGRNGAGRTTTLESAAADRGFVPRGPTACRRVRPSVVRVKFEPRASQKPSCGIAHPRPYARLRLR